jgi:hypothetical protein
MRRSRAAATLAAALLFTTAAAARPASPPVRASGVVTINVTFMCDGKRSVDPWEAHAKAGDDIVWVLAAESDATRIRIKAKKSADWPLSGNAPEGGKGNPGRGKVKGDAAKGRSSYDIEARCGNEWKRIDPDIIIDG